LYMEESISHWPAAPVLLSVYPTLTESWAALGWFVLISNGVAVLIMVPAEAIWPASAPIPRLWATAGATVASLLLTLAWLRRRAGSGRWPARPALPSRAGWGSYALMPMLWLACEVILSPLHLLKLPDWTAATFTKMAEIPALIFSFGCVVIPVLEEFLFRRVLLEVK